MDAVNTLRKNRGLTGINIAIFTYRVPTRYKEILEDQRVFVDKEVLTLDNPSKLVETTQELEKSNRVRIKLMDTNKKSGYITLKYIQSADSQPYVYVPKLNIFQKLFKRIFKF